MAKKQLEGLEKFNRVSKPMNLLFCLVFFLGAAACVVPLLFIIIISFTDKNSINAIGYSFFPQQWSVEAYKQIFTTNIREILGAFGMSILITVLGTLIGLWMNATMGYVLSRGSFKFKKLYTMIIFIPMLFSGGMMASYMVITRFLYLKDTIWVLILPMAVASYNIIILRTFFQTTVPDSLIESGKIDGASQLRIFFQICLPISLPALATIGLFLAFGYWNDWYNALMYIENEKLYPLQYLLMEIEKNMELLTQHADRLGISAAEFAQKIPQDGVRMAMVVLAVLPITCTYPFFQRYFISGLTIGAVKG